MTIAQIKDLSKDTAFRSQLKDTIVQLNADIEGLELAKKDLVAAHTEKIKRLKKRLKTAVKDLLSDEAYLFDYATPDDFFADKGV
jgi:hypothetical protein